MPNPLRLVKGSIYSFETRISRLIPSYFLALNLICCFSSRLAFSTTTQDVFLAHHLNNIIYSFTCDCVSEYTGKTTQQLAKRIRRHIPPGLGRFTLGLCNYSSPENSPPCLVIVCSSNVLGYFSVLACARNPFHSDVLEVVFIKIQSPPLCLQK